MKKCLLLILIGFITQMVIAQNWTCGKEGGVVFAKVTAESGLNMRAESNTNSKVLLTIPFNTEVVICRHSLSSHSFIEIDEVKGSWVKVNYQNKTGFVFDGFLKYEDNAAIILNYQSIDSIQVKYLEDSYYGLYKNDSLPNLINVVKLKTEIVYMDEDQNIIHFVKALFPDSKPPDILLADYNQNIKKEIYGRIYPVYPDGSKIVYPGESIRYLSSVIYATGNPIKSSSDFSHYEEVEYPFSGIKNYKLKQAIPKINGGYIDYILYEADTKGVIKQAFVNFVGDLDNDNKLDIIFTVITDENCEERILLLSSKADKKFPLGERIRTVGCNC